MTKHKHNKKRNTAFLYESLVIQLTKSVLENKKEEQVTIKKLLREHFNKGSILLNDLRIYQAITETNSISPNMAERILSEVKKQKEAIDKKQLFNEQNKLINKINKLLPKTFFSNFVPNYKDLASIAQIFNISVPIKSRVLLEAQILNKMSTETTEKEMLPIDSFTYKVFTEKFNKEYSDKLSNEQKTLLKKYISSFEDDGLELKVYLDEEIGRLKKEVGLCFSETIISEDEVLKEKLHSVENVLNTFKVKEPTEDMLTKIISIQSLIQEIHTNVN